MLKHPEPTSLTSEARAGQPNLSLGAAIAFDTDYSDPQAIEAFAKALADTNDTDPYSSPSLNGPSSANNTAAAAIRSASDWAPIKQKIKKSAAQGGGRKDVVREGWAYDLSRWPLLSLLFTLITFEFLGYILVRQLVNVVEWGFYCELAFSIFILVPRSTV